MMSNSYEYGKIYRTTEYDMFKSLDGNREVTGYMSIIRSIEEVGYVLSPILVNEKMEVVDGQNRLRALRILGKPVDYIIQEGIGIKECRSLNIGQKNWTFSDFIKSYSADGNANYTRLLGLLGTYQKDFAIDGVLCANKHFHIVNGGGIKYPIVQDGSLILSKEDCYDSAKTLETLKGLGYVDFFKNNKMTARTYWRAVMYANRNPECDMARLIKQMNQYQLQIVSCSKVEDQLRYLENVYNKSLRKDCRIYLSTDYQKGVYNEF